MSSTTTDLAALPRTQSEWRAALAALPSTPENIPAFYFAHGSPMLASPENSAGRNGRGAMMEHMGPHGPLANFLRDFGPVLLEKYKPKGIVVFSAHWDTTGERLVTDYGSENPLLYDYYGFDREFYELKFKSRGDSALSNRVVSLFKEAGHLARTTPTHEPRGRDGRGHMGPGFDHGVFIPFRLMFGETFLDVPIVEVSMDGTLSPEKNWAVGQAVKQLREEGILVLSGGLTVHNLRDFSSFAESTAGPLHKSFDGAVLDAVTVPQAAERRQAMLDLVKHKGFRAAHPREDHFVPLYIAAGAGEGGDVRVLNAVYGVHTCVFGL